MESLNNKALEMLDLIIKLIDVTRDMTSDELKYLKLKLEIFFKGDEMIKVKRKIRRQNEARYGNK